MTHPRNTTASPKRRLPVPDGDLAERSLRARTEPMAVTAFGTNAYEVETDSGTYMVDLGAGRCTCPDHRFRGARCKHLRRVAIEVTEGRVPPPGHVAVDCRDCDREVFVGADAVDDGPHYCEFHRVGPGDSVRDRETGHRLVVVTHPARRADEVSIPEAGGTVADYRTNRAYDPDEPVVGAVYPRARVTGEGVDPRQLQVYSFPRSRLVRVDAEPERAGDARGRRGRTAGSGDRRSTVTPD